VLLVEPRGSDGRPLYPRHCTGIVVASPSDPEHAYRVELPRGEVLSFKRRDIEVLSIFQSSQGRTDPLSSHELSAHIIYRCIVGSRAYGLDHEDSDTDRRGVYVPPASLHWSLYGVPEQLENAETEECYWELQKYLTLALKANPNVLETLYTPLVEHATPLADQMRSMRAAFLSKIVYQTFNGYAISQFRKIEQDQRTKQAVKWKHAMHMIRLLHAGIAALRTGELPVAVDPTIREELLAIRSGLMPWEVIDLRRQALHAAFDRAFERTSLPDRPDYDRVNDLLVLARRAMVDADERGETK
jgi:hypothetical protein